LASADIGMVRSCLGWFWRVSLVDYPAQVAPAACNTVERTGVHVVRAILAGSR
jgi:hypothetical protein